MSILMRKETGVPGKNPRVRLKSSLPTYRRDAGRDWWALRQPGCRRRQFNTSPYYRFLDVEIQWILRWLFDFDRPDCRNFDSVIIIWNCMCGSKHPENNLVSRICLLLPSSGAGEREARDSEREGKRPWERRCPEHRKISKQKVGTSK